MKKQPYGGIRMGAVSLSKLLDPFAESPWNFPKDIGIFIYNKEFDSLKKYSWSKEEIRFFRESLLQECKRGRGETWYSIFKKMTNKAIKGKRSTKDDKRRLLEAFSNYQEYKVEDVKENGRWFPFISFKSNATIPSSIALLLQWVHYVWRRAIKVQICKAEDCDRVFIPLRSDQEYCSEKCYNRQYKRERRALARDKKITP